MIKPILEEFFAVFFIIITLWIAGKGALSLYTKFKKVTTETTTIKGEKK